MTEDRMALIELLQKSEDGDFLRSVAEAVLQLLMEADVEGLIGAARHERSAERLNYRRYHAAPGEVGRPARRQSWIRARVSAPVAQQLPFLSLSS
jgi:transposase-like protein